MKRLAKLQASVPSSSQTPSPAPSVPPPNPKPTSPAPTFKKPPEPVAAPVSVPPKKKALAAPPKFDYAVWESETIRNVFEITLDVSFIMPRLIN